MGNKQKTSLGVVFFLFLGMSSVMAQFDKTDGFPFIQNFPANEYGGHIQNWGFAQDSEGILYVANATGLMLYDGLNWHSIEVINSRTYAVESGLNNRIYIGGINEFGFVEALENSNSIPQYQSLRSLLPDSLDFSVIWEVVNTDDYIFFYSKKYLFQFDGSNIKIHTANNSFSGIFEFNETIYVVDIGHGIYKFENNTLKPSFESEFFRNTTLRNAFTVADKTLYCSYDYCYEERNQQFSLFETEAKDYLKEKIIDEAIPLADGTILFATRKGGLVNVDADGNLIHILNEETGLINNTVYGVYEDPRGLVWAATVNGISKIEYSLPLRIFDQRSGITSIVKRMDSTRQGLIGVFGSGFFHFKEDELDVMGEDESCSRLFKMINTLYGICNNDLFIQKGNALQEIHLEPAVNEAAVYAANDKIAIVGNEVSYHLIKLNGDEAEILYLVDDISSRPNSIVVDDQQNIWIGTDAHGLFRLRLVEQNGEIVDHTLENYLTNLHNSANDPRVFVTKLEGRPVFLTWGKGIQRYNSEANSLELVTGYGELFSDTTKQVFWASEDQNQNVWFRFDQQYVAALKQPDNSYKSYQGILNRLPSGQSNTIFSDEMGFIWYSIGDRLVRYQPDHDFNYQQDFPTHIIQVLVRNDSLLNSLEGAENVLEYKDNELRFSYAAASYDDPQKIQYRVKLEGFDPDWGPWTSEFQKDYTNIPEGKYNFIVEAKNAYGTISRSQPFHFSVLPPWYRTWWAYLLYTFTIACILYIAYKIRVNQLLRVERIRNSIANDLHDEVSATLSSISYFAQAVKSNSKNVDKSRFIDLIFNSAVDAKEKISDIVWAINPEHDHWQSFLSKCRRFASDLFESKGIKYSLKIAEDIPGNLDMQLRQHLWLVYKEMVTNAARHSEAKNVNVIFNHEDGFLNLIVQDDGKGMDVDAVKKGNGLVNIQKRVDEIKGRILLTSEPDFGTRWALKIPL